MTKTKMLQKRKPKPSKKAPRLITRGLKTPEARTIARKDANAIGWGILGTGRIAKALAKAINASSTGRLVAVGSRSAESAQKFGDEFSIPTQGRFGSYEAVINHPNVTAIYISLPNDLHALWVDRCAEAGKHVLCEKPLAMNFPEAMRMIESARYHNVFLMEAFMYRCHPQTAKLVELIKRKTIGDVRIIQANFAYNAGDEWDDIRFKPENGGGGIMDVGCYTMSMARLVAGAAVGEDFANPVEVKGSGHIGAKSKVDQWAVATARFQGPDGRDIVANLACGMSIGIDATLRIFGTQGNILVPNPWFPGEKGNKIIVQGKGDKEPRTIVVDGNAGLYTIEANVVAKNLKHGQAPSPCMTWADTLGNMKALDDWRKSIGLFYAEEKADSPAASFLPMARRPLKRRPDQQMIYGNVAGVGKPISRVVMGSMIFNNNELALTRAMLDNFVEMGGNCIDTAHFYAGGQSEQAIGHWMKARGNREQIVILDKGAHPPHCTPKDAGRHVMECLQRLQTDYIDIFLLHRDNLEFPVGEWVEVLNEHHRAGHIRAFGGSNWTTERIEAANEYARSHGLVGFAASSPNFSLARWNKPTWEGCVGASDPESRTWHTRTQMPLFSWSSQANGFFTGRYSRGHGQAAPGDYMSTLVVPIWFNDDNFTRLERAQKMAKKKGVTATQIALAYVLNQAFPTFALIGARTIEETRTSLDGVALKLTPDEVRWLNLED